MKTIPVLTAAALVLFISAAAHAFDGFTDGDGSHFEITGTAWTQVFRTDPAAVVGTKTAPVYGFMSWEFDEPRLGDAVKAAAGAPDLWDFGFLPPHSQSDDYNYKKEFDDAGLLELERKALEAWLLYCGCLLDRIRAEFAGGNLREGAFLLGYYIHTFQDLFAHKGMTNAHHRFLDAAGNSPDYDPASIEEARVWTVRFLEAFPDMLDDDGRRNFSSAVESGIRVDPLGRKEADRLLGRRRDVFLEGILYTIAPQPKERAMRYAQRISWDYLCLAGLFCDPATAWTDPGDLLAASGYRF